MNKPVKYMPAEPTWNQIEAAIPFLSRPADTPDRQRRVVRELYRAMWELSPEQEPSKLPGHQAEVHMFVAHYMAENNKAPTYREIAAAMGVKTRQEAYQCIVAMERRGILVRTKIAGHRSIRLLVMPGDPVPIMPRGS